MINGDGGRPRPTWNSVTDAGGTPPGIGDGDSGKSAFEFDLGGALARLSGESDAPADAPNPPSTPPTAFPADRIDPAGTPTSASPAATEPPAPSTTPASPAAEPPTTPSASGQQQAPAVRPPSGPDASPPVASPPPVGPASSGVPPAAPNAETSAPSAPPTAHGTPTTAPAPPAPATPPATPASPPPSTVAPASPSPSSVAPGPSTAGPASAPEAPATPVVSPGAGFTWTSTPSATPAEGEQPVASLTWNEPLPSRTPTPARPEPARAPAADPARSDAAGSSWFDHGTTPAQPAGSNGAGPDAASRGGAAAPTSVPPVETAPVANNYPRRVPGTHFDAQQPPAPVPEPSAPAPAPAATPPAARQSVFDDGASLHGGVPSLAGGAAASGTAPILPDANPAAPPKVAEPASAGPDNADLTALRSAQLRQNKQQRQGRLFGRSLLAFVLIGGMLGAGLVFGRSLLFPTEWDAQMTPIVNQLQDSTGVEFDGAVPFVLLSADEYAARLGASAVGDGWSGQIPQWRALGLANGDVDADLVGAGLGTTMAQSTTAFFDPSNETIYRSDSVAATDADLRVALTAALEHQLSTADDPAAEPSPDAAADAGSTGGAEVVVEAAPSAADQVVVGFTGVSPLSDIATRAIDRLLTNGAVAERPPAPEDLPVPIAYEVAAVGILGESILASAGVDASTLEPGTPYPASVTGALDDAPVETASALLQPGEIAIADAAALGTDDWSLVWSVGLPQSTVLGLIDQVAADSYRAVERDGTVCVLGVFQTADEVAGANVMAAMTTWALNAPAAAQASAAQLSATRVQLTTCDPGPESPFTPNARVVDDLLDRQQRRLSN